MSRESAQTDGLPKGRERDTGQGGDAAVAQPVRSGPLEIGRAFKLPDHAVALNPD
jgi:hypothetical protein